MHRPQRQLIIRDVIEQVVGSDAIVCETQESTTCELQVEHKSFDLAFNHNSWGITLNISWAHVNAEPYVIRVYVGPSIQVIRRTLVNFIKDICFDTELADA